MSMLCVLYNETIWNGPLAKMVHLTVASPLTCFLQKSYIFIDFLWLHFAQLARQKLPNFEPRLWPVQWVQNPVNFEKNWQIFCQNYFFMLRILRQWFGFGKGILKSWIIIKRETRQISVELLIWKISIFYQKNKIFGHFKNSKPITTEKRKFHSF